MHLLDDRSSYMITPHKLIHFK